MSSYSDTARLSANPDLHFDDPHPDLLPTGPRDNATASSSSSGSEHRGMIKGMTARYDKNTKLATGTTMDEYRRLNMRATTVGMWGGILAGGLITAALKRRTALSRNALTFSFLFTASSLSYGISQSMIQNRLSEVVAKANDAKLPRDPGGGGLMVLDNAQTDHSTDLINVKSDEEVMRDELRNLGKDRRRTRWGKGVGLDGEVEEEPELRDTFFRPGVPRRDG